MLPVLFFPLQDLDDLLFGVFRALGRIAQLLLDLFQVLADLFCFVLYR